MDGAFAVGRAAAPPLYIVILFIVHNAIIAQIRKISLFSISQRQFRNQYSNKDGKWKHRDLKALPYYRNEGSFTRCRFHLSRHLLRLIFWAPSVINRYIENLTRSPRTQIAPPFISRCIQIIVKIVSFLSTRYSTTVNIRQLKKGKWKIKIGRPRPRI